jgi:hypothetical protein
MVVVSMNPMPPKVIGKKNCLCVRGLFGLSKDPGPKRHPNTWRKEESKEVKDSMMVEKGVVHHKKYEGYYMKQWVRIPKATWTSPIIGKRSTCQTSSNGVSLMKDDVNDEVPNGTPKNLIHLMG